MNHNHSTLTPTPTPTPEVIPGFGASAGIVAVAIVVGLLGLRRRG